MSYVPTEALTHQYESSSKSSETNCVYSIGWIPHNQNHKPVKCQTECRQPVGHPSRRPATPRSRAQNVLTPRAQKTQHACHDWDKTRKDICLRIVHSLLSGGVRIEVAPNVLDLLLQLVLGALGGTLKADPNQPQLVLRSTMSNSTTTVSRNMFLDRCDRCAVKNIRLI